MKFLTFVTVGISLIGTVAFGHGNGRLFDVAVMDGKLVARGFNNGGPDGLDTIRTYVNSIHDHFNFIGTSTQPLGVTNFPSWDVGILNGSDISLLNGYELRIELIGSGKWVNVPAQDGTGVAQDFGIPDLFVFSAENLSKNPTEIIRVKFAGKTIDTMNLGEFQMMSAIDGPTEDLDFEYFIDNHNSSEIYFIEFKLKTDAPGVSDSDSIYVIQSPDGIGAIERMHFQSLYLETYLGKTIPKVLVGDVNQDGVITLLDVQPFVAVVGAGRYQKEADINLDGRVDLKDVNPFVELLSGN